MSSVLALKRNSSTVRYCFEADAEPGVLPRALELLAKRGLVPARVFAQADADLLSVEIEVDGLAPDTADHVDRGLSQVVGERQTFCGRRHVHGPPGNARRRRGAVRLAQGFCAGPVPWCLHGTRNRSLAPRA